MFVFYCNYVNPACIAAIPNKRFSDFSDFHAVQYISALRSWCKHSEADTTILSYDQLWAASLIGRNVFTWRWALSYVHRFTVTWCSLNANVTYTLRCFLFTFCLFFVFFCHTTKHIYTQSFVGHGIAPSCDIFNRGSSYFHVPLTTMRHLLMSHVINGLLGEFLVVPRKGAVGGHIPNTPLRHGRIQ